MVPPAKYMVNMHRKLMIFLPFSSFLVRAYAAQMVKNIPMTVKVTVTTTDTNSDRIIDESANTLAYAFRLIPLGSKNILFAVTYASALIDFANICKKGNTQVNEDMVK